ncbi:hypothetical protein SASK001_10460 [Staphylococcus argenteus]|nr:hypothetical protein SA19082_08180 [Staphylococcus argenteus]GJF51535.1 hypothetical protein SA19086_08420 [Staphylococcus argenteus]GJF56156.1 hypothetical protein SA19103_02960 [Staphylococcus argenteus]GJF63953.1 hypothetical protein SA19133_02940 [Staphylococcus argenteus]GJF74190.1 hypothetical protein SA19220_02960 [Staphylococcus argenteus]
MLTLGFGCLSFSKNAETPVNKPNTLDNTLKTVADMTQINFCVLETMSYLYVKMSRYK